MKRLVNNTLSNKMKINFNVFGPSMVNRIRSELSGIEIIIEQIRGRRMGKMEFSKKCFNLD